MFSIIATAAITFIITTLWASYSYTKGHKNLYVSFEAMLNELDNIARELGHKNITTYWTVVKGKEYSDRAKENVEGALGFLRNK